METLRIGTRGSQLAIWQANWIRDQILARHPSIHIELVIIKTQGDKILDRPLSTIGGKGLFVKELETAMMENQTDMAVHSMKDVPGLLPDGLEIQIITKRENAYDGLVSSQISTLDELPKNAVIGTSSLRRGAQLKAFRPDLQIKNLRGNVDTRLKKILNHEYDAAIMAVAGMKRLGLSEHIRQSIPFSIMLPAVAQGTIGIETRIGDKKTLSYLHHLHDINTADCLDAERALLKALEGNCQIPLAGHCIIVENQLRLTALVASPCGTHVIRRKAASNRSDAESLGNSIAQQILDNGGKEILQSLEG
ncbi:MAG: hydroxymethylbilane synthase [SAR324 cluster bacterium]|nr:hydroxymethylbilane synthase [SAR324 cluster bacterium]